MSRRCPPQFARVEFTPSYVGALWGLLSGTISPPIPQVSDGVRGQYAEGVANQEAETPLPEYVVHVHEDFKSAFLPPRRLLVALPPAYDADETRRFPVL